MLVLWPFTLCAVLVYVAFTRTRVGAVMVLWPSRSLYAGPVAFTLRAVLVYVAFTRTRVGAVLVLWPSRSALGWPCGLHECFCAGPIWPSRSYPAAVLVYVAFTPCSVLVFVAFTSTRSNRKWVYPLAGPPSRPPEQQTDLTTQLL